MSDALSPLVVRLGAGRGRVTLAGKARRLDEAAAAGFDVPAGFVLRHEAWLDARRRGWWTPDGWCDGQAALRLWACPDIGARVAVRSAFGGEDDGVDSAAGRFTTRLDVDARDADALLAALHDVWSSAPDGTAMRRDVLVMAMVDAERAGVLFTETEHELDLVDWTAGTAEHLVGGRDPGRALRLPKRRTLERGDRRLEPWQRRLQGLARDLRRVFGERDRDVEWADDGARCRLLQVRPITRPVFRDERFTMANHREILPDPPSPFMASLIGSCADELFAGYRRFDPALPSTRPFLEVFRGRPMINLSLLTDMLRWWGLPTSLVTSSIGGSEGDDGAGIRPQRWLARAGPLLRLAWAQARAPASARRTAEALVARTRAPGETLGELVATARDVYVRLVHEMFLLTGAMSGPLAALSRAGTLAAHERGFVTTSSTLYRELAALRDLVDARPAVRAALARGEVPDDAAFASAWSRYVERFGHRGVFESDVARPRLREDPAPTLRGLATRASVAPARRPSSSPGVLRRLATRPLWWAARGALAARESLRDRAMVAFGRVRGALLECADTHVARGALRRRDDLWLLTVDEVSRLDGGWTPTADDWRAFEERHARDRARPVPDVATRTELARDVVDTDPRAAGSTLAGLVLAEGVVTGRAWVLHEPGADPPDDFDPSATVLVARSVDAGWVATFGRVAGVAVEIGGSLSHGSIILREIGLPSITNVAGATSAIATGDRVRLDASAGCLERLDG